MNNQHFSTVSFNIRFIEILFSVMNVVSSLILVLGELFGFFKKS